MNSSCRAVLFLCCLRFITAFTAFKSSFYRCGLRPVLGCQVVVMLGLESLDSPTAKTQGFVYFFDTIICASKMAIQNCSNGQTRRWCRGCKLMEVRSCIQSTWVKAWTTSSSLSPSLPRRPNI